MSQDFNCHEALLQCKATEDITGMSVRDITEHLQALYGIELSATPISNITDKVSQEAKDWYCGRWTAFTRLYSLMPCILKYVKKGGS